MSTRTEAVLKCLYLAQSCLLQPALVASLRIKLALGIVKPSCCQPQHRKGVDGLTFVKAFARQEFVTSTPTKKSERGGRSEWSWELSPIKKDSRNGTLPVPLCQYCGQKGHSSDQCNDEMYY
ncbi:hypothetical protein AAG570_003587 [Ranatra chinensis]|uniref:CCHC-type domain-containing protein n=1 Tax=Ranatra chinensis TaxID=642074 RepID=A0ABD0YII6_9HEMI